MKRALRESAAALARPAILGGSPAFLNPLPTYISTGPREAEAAAAVMCDGTLSGFLGTWSPAFHGGPRVRSLERRWAEYFGVLHAVSVNSATSGLHAALVAAGVTAGDEVIVPPVSMSATAAAVVMAGGVPVFVDQEEATCCLDPERARAAVGPKTRAIIAVNLFGGPAALLQLRSLADERGLVLIEDNAQGPGGRHRGRYLGTIGHIGVFSLNTHKAIQCGEGGVVTTDDDRFARRLRLVRNHGENAVEPAGWLEDADIVGHNYRLTELQAAIAEVQLERLEELTVPRVNAAEALSAALAKCSATLRVPRVEPGDRHVYYLFPLWYETRTAGLSRDRFVAALAAEGAPVVGGYVKPLYHLPLFRRLLSAGRARIAEPDGVCTQAERAFAETLLYTTVVQLPGALELVGRFVEAVDKILAHAEEIGRTV